MIILKIGQEIFLTLLSRFVLKMLNRIFQRINFVWHLIFLFLLMNKYLSIFINKRYKIILQ